MLLSHFVVVVVVLKCTQYNDIDKRIFTTKQCKQKYIYISTNKLLRTLQKTLQMFKYSLSNICVGVCYLGGCEKTKYQKCWLVGFYGISIFVGYLMPSPFLCK